MLNSRICHSRVWNHIEMKISAAAPCRLTNLRRLALLSNRLESMAGLAACTALEELYLSHNGISAIEVPIPKGHIHIH